MAAQVQQAEQVQAAGVPRTPAWTEEVDCRAQAAAWALSALEVRGWARAGRRLMVRAWLVGWEAAAIAGALCGGEGIGGGVWGLGYLVGELRRLGVQVTAREAWGIWWRGKRRAWALQSGGCA